MTPAALDWAKGNGFSCRFPNQQFHGTFDSYLILRSRLCSLLTQSVWEKLKSPPNQSCGVPFADLAQCAAVSIVVVWPCMMVPALTLFDLTKLQTSAAWWGGVLFWLVSKCYVVYNVTLLLAVFTLNLYPTMMPTSDSTNFFLSTIFLTWLLLVLLFAIWCSSDPVPPSLCGSPCIVGISYCHSIYSAVTACLFFIFWFFSASSLDDLEFPCLHLT